MSSVGDDESLCDSDDSGIITFAYSVIYFFTAWFVMFLLQISPLGNKPTEDIGTSCLKYWKLYEDEDEDDISSLMKGKSGRMIKRARKRLTKCCKNKMAKLVKPDKKGRDTAYLNKLLEGVDFFMGDNGTYFKKDFYYYVSNNHGFFSIISAERGHPFRRVERNFSFLTLGSLTFFGVVGGSYFGTSSTHTLMFQLAMAVMNFLLTNAFQVLFACSCLFSTGAEKRNPLTKCFETGGTVVGCLMALVLSVGMQLFASVLCGDGGVALVTFVIRSQIPSILIGLGMVYRHYIPYVLHLSDLPFIGDMTVLGSWYLDKYEASCEHGERWVQEGVDEEGGGGGRSCIKREQFRFLEINFLQYCCPLIPYFTTNADFDPEKKKRDRAEANAKAAEAPAPGLLKSKIHPSSDPPTKPNKDKGDIEFNDIEEAN